MSRYINTYENHPSDDLKTHWFKTDYMGARNAIIDIARDLGMNIVNINDEYKELFVVSPKYKLMIKVTEYTVGETSIDIYMEKLKFLDFYAWRKFFALWHSRLKKKLIFLGIALHP